MEIQDHIKTTTLSEHENHGVHLCHRCGWPFPNSHPSAKHRRAHKKICGTMDGYAKFTQHPFDHKTPSPKIDKRGIQDSGGGGGGGGGGSCGGGGDRSEDELFSDAVAEFSDCVISPRVKERLAEDSDKILDMDSLQSFKDAENSGTTTLFESPKMNDNLENFETPDTDLRDSEKFEENKVKTACDQSEAKGECSESLVKDVVVESTPFNNEVSQKVKSFDLVEPDVNMDQGEEHFYVFSFPSGVHVEDQSKPSTQIFKSHETKGSDGVKDTIDEICTSAGDKTSEEKMQETRNSGKDESLVNSAKYSEVNAEESESQRLETCKTTSESLDNLVEVEGSRGEIEQGKLIDTRLGEEIKQENNEFDQENAPEKVKEVNIDDGVSGLTFEDLDVRNSKKSFKDYAQEVIEEPQIVYKAEPGSDDVSEPMANQDTFVDSSSQNSIEGNWGSVSVSGSIEGNWGSVSVSAISTASVDAKTSYSVDRAKVNSESCHSSKSDVFEAPSFMTLVEPKGEVVDGKPAERPRPEPSRAGWFPTLTNISNESEGRKRNEEVIAKVTSWTTAKHSAPLKNLPDPRHMSTVIRRDEADDGCEKTDLPSGRHQESSLPEYIGGGKKARKKVKGRASWVPFVCCSSVNGN